MRIIRPKCPPAIALIGRIDAESMNRVLRYLDCLGAGLWEVSRVGESKDGQFFEITYRPLNRPGIWSATFGMDGRCWSD